MALGRAGQVYLHGREGQGKGQPSAGQGKGRAFGVTGLLNRADTGAKGDTRHRVKCESSGSVTGVLDKN